MTDEQPPLEAVRYDDGTVSYPAHARSQSGGVPVERIDLQHERGRIITWTSSNATPPGVTAPNHLAIVEFTLDDASSVRVIGQLTTDAVETGDLVKPVYVPQLRDPEKAIRSSESQSWDGYQFAPVDD